jgi:RNA polymerase sigma-70 factor (ECF subfamily)
MSGPSDSSPREPRPLLDPERWVEEHGDALFAVARFSVRNPAVAEDLVQDTLLAAWKGRERFEGRSSERTWLTGILKNKIREHLRTKARLVTVTDLVPEEPTLERMFDPAGHVVVGHAPGDWGDDPAGAASARSSGAFWLPVWGSFRTVPRRCSWPGKSTVCPPRRSRPATA